MRLKVIAIGASAGGLEPLRVILGALPAAYPAAVIVAQHLSPSHASLLVELLARSASLPVIEITDGLQLRAGHIHVTPPNHDIEVRDGAVWLLPPVVGPGPKPRINRLFQSIADSCAESGVGVVLSGTGSDGAIGLEALRNAGALTLVQSPETCQHDGMPRAALDLSAADGQLSPAALGSYLAALNEHEPSPELIESSDALERLLVLATRASGVDLNRYRRKSLTRRVARRMALLRQPTLEGYNDWCASHPDELRLLVNDLFINVTQFFRDNDAFETLRTTLRNRLRETTDRSEFRVWVAGCSTGEEAYSLAILLHEIAEEIGRPYQYRVFATDISERVIQRARAGIYSEEAAEDLGPARSARFLTLVTDGFQINRQLRDRVVFSTNDLAKDAPFSRIDLVSCRNLLIYFNPDHQRVILQTLHYALRPEGLLMLGSSETTAPAGELFRTLSDTAHLYMKEGESRLPPSLRLSRPINTAPVVGRSRAPETDAVELRLLRDLVREHAPVTVVVNQANELMFSSGELGAFMNLPSGAGTLDVSAMLLDGLRAPVRAAMFQRRRSEREEPVKIAVPLETGQLVDVEVQCFDPLLRKGWLRLSLATRSNPLQAIEQQLQPRDEVEARLFQTLESELFSTRSSLQMVVQELETANEDLQVVNEELQSTNEEFQSTNEELQTTNEELRSTNEELLTVNDELNQKSIELERAHTDISNVLESLPTPLLLVNHDLRVRLFSPSIDQLVQRHAIRPEDGLLALRWKVEIPGLRDQVWQVIYDGVSRQGEFEHEGQNWKYQISPVNDRHRGEHSALLLFIDVTELRRAHQLVTQQRGAMERSFASISDALVHLTEKDKARASNQAALALFGVETTQQIPLDECGLRLDQDGSAGEPVTLAMLRDRVLSQNEQLMVTVHLLGSDGTSARVLSLIAQPLGEGEEVGVLVLLRDVESGRREHEMLVWSSNHDELTGFLNRRGFDKQLRKAAQQATPQTLLFLDLDQFKAANDIGGHAAGDEVLRQIAALIRDQVGVPGVVGRLGGDEFCVILSDTTIDSGLLIAEKLRALIELLRVPWKGAMLRVGVSIGVARIEIGDDSGCNALAQADAACIQAKAYGRNRVESVSVAAMSQLSGRLQDAHLVQLLKDSIEHGKLTHTYEILKPLQPGRPARMELLTRIRDAAGLPISTFTVISSAERAGLVRHVDEQAFAEALRLAALLPAARVERIHVNVSPNSLAVPAFAEGIESSLRRQPELARRISFEITETAAFANLASLRTFADQVRPLGAEIFLDDFGTGSSVLGQVRELRLDGLKIDGAFVRSMMSSPVDTTIVQAIQQIAEAMSLVTVAEYVRDESTAQQLRDMRIGYAQGDWAGRELSHEAILKQFRD